MCIFKMFQLFALLVCQLDWCGQDGARQQPGLCSTAGPTARPHSSLPSEEAGEKPVALQGLEGDVRPDHMRHLHLRTAQETEEKS